MAAPTAVVEEAPELPVVGLPGTDFYAIHVTAIVSLSISILASTGVLIYLFAFTSKARLHQRPVGERLVVYLAIYDLFFSVTHELDHGYMLAVLDHPPDDVCMAFAFLLQTFIMAQSLMVLFTAINAMVMVVMKKKISLGRYDWRLFAVTMGVPLVCGVVGLAVPFLGPTGMWCMVDMRKSYGTIVNNFYGMAMVVVFLANAICYGAIYFKIRQVALKTGLGGGESGESKYHRTARMMTLFVLVYLFQWWTFVVQALWGLAEVPHISIYILGVLIINLGGVYNALAYTVIRRRYSSVGAVAAGDCSVNSSGNTPALRAISSSVP